MTIVVVLGVAAQQGPMSLGDCINLALDKHPDLSIARTDVDTARVNLDSTRAGYLPSLSIESNHSYYFVGKRPSIYVDGSEVPYPQDAYDDDLHGMGLYLRQSIFDGLAYWYRPQKAHAQIEQAKAGVEDTKERVILGVVNAYYGLLGKKKSLEVFEQALRLSMAQLELASERRKLGAASSVDVSKAELAVGEDRISVERQKILVDKAIVDLRQAMGVGQDFPINIQDGPFLQPPDDLHQEVYSGHVLLRINRAAMEVAQQQVQIASSGWWPKVSAGISYSRQDPEFYKVYSRFDELYHLSFWINFSYPIFEGFTTQAAVEGAELQAERVRKEGQKVKKDLEASLARSTTQLMRLVEIKDIEKDNIRAAQRSLYLAQEQYKLGRGTALEVRDAQLAVTRAKLNLIQTRYDLQLSLAAYHRSRGDLVKTYLHGDSP